MRNLKKMFFAVLLTTIVVMMFCACSNKSTSSNKNNNKNSIMLSEGKMWDPLPTESEEEYENFDIVTTAITTYKEKETSTVTAYVASCAPADNNANRATTQTKVAKTSTLNSQNNSNNSNKTNKSAKQQAVSTLGRQSTSITTTKTGNSVKSTIQTTAKKDDVYIATTSKKETSSVITAAPRYTPNLYVETAPDIISNSPLSESEGEFFQASATIWFQDEAELRNVANVLDNIDCEKINVGQRFDFNDYLKQNSLKTEDKIEYLASVLLFESSRAAQMQVNENSFPELADFYEDSNRLARNSENLTLTNDTKNAFVTYVYVNTYSQSITVSWYATKA